MKKNLSIFVSIGLLEFYLKSSGRQKLNFFRKYFASFFLRMLRRVGLFGQKVITVIPSICNNDNILIIFDDKRITEYTTK